jgi:hypothetical protein
VPPPPTAANEVHGGSSAPPPVPNGPTPSVIAVALFQFLGSLPILYMSGIALWGAARIGELRNSPMVSIVYGSAFLFSLAGIVASAGLLRLREWARTTTLCLATLPLLWCALFLMLYEPKLPRSYDIVRPIVEILFGLLVPISFWWWVLFTRSSVRSQFHRV